MQMQARMDHPPVLLPEATKALARLVVAIANINVWNRLNVAVRQPVGAWNG